MLEVGSPCPDFTLPATDGSDITPGTLRGRNAVIYFYPKDLTPGCTTEALEFSELLPAFEAVNAVVIGISKDSIARHEKFIAKHDLKIELGSDESGEVCDAFGVWVEKNMYGRKYMGIERATYLINEDGIIQSIWRKVKVKGHVQAVLGALSP